MNAPQRFDAVVVGAGPYGLSTAAHLAGRGLSVGVFGKPLELWRDHMPKGMLLRSHWWASHLSDPRKEYRLDRFLSRSKYSTSYPMSREVFVEYGLWFQEHAVPHVDDAYVASIARQDKDFLLTLKDGRTVAAAAVVMATGLSYYANRLDHASECGKGLVSHSSDHRDLSVFRGATVVVVGGGQSALEYAALLHETGAHVHLVSRRPIVWIGPDTGARRSAIKRMLAPNTSLAPGWKNWVLEHAPTAFYRFPQERRDKANRNYYLSAGAGWLRPRVVGQITLHEGHTATFEPGDGHVDVTISDGERVRAAHVILATGYTVNIDRLAMIHPALRAEITSDHAVPALSPWFESSVRGLYFVGFTSLRAFGPVFRFVGGCGVTARRVARAIARAS